MACATLKRHIDWEPVLGVRPSKRRRCNPVCPSSERNNSSRLYRSPRPSTSACEMYTAPVNPSPFANVVCPNITPGMCNNRYKPIIDFSSIFIMLLSILILHKFHLVLNCHPAWFDLFIYICHQLFFRTIHLGSGGSVTTWLILPILIKTVFYLQINLFVFIFKKNKK